MMHRIFCMDFPGDTQHIQKRYSKQSRAHLAVDHTILIATSHMSLITSFQHPPGVIKSFCWWTRTLCVPLLPCSSPPLSHCSFDQQLIITHNPSFQRPLAPCPEWNCTWTARHAGPKQWRYIPPSFLIHVHNKYTCTIVFVQPKPIQHRNGMGNEVKSMDRKITKQDIGSGVRITNRACVKITASCTYHYHRGRSLVHRLHTHRHTKPHSVKTRLSQKGNIKLDMPSLSLQLWYTFILLPWWLASCDCLICYNLLFLFAQFKISRNLTKISYRY